MSPGQTELLLKTLLLLTVMIAGGATAAFAFRDYFNLPVVIGSFVVTVLLIVINALVIQPSNNPLLIVPFDFAFGAAWGADLGGFALARADSRGKRHLLGKAVAVSLGIMLIATWLAGAIGLLSGIDFQPWQGTMLVGLFILLGVTLLGIAIRFDRVVQFVIGVVASLFWIVYLVVDFNRIIALKGDTSWGAAQSVAIQVYADLVNLFVQLLPVVLELMDE